HEFPLPETTRNYQITAGPDGNLWATLFDASKIVRITPSGGVTEYLIPTSDSGPYGIITGPDGALWFAEYKASQIGKITPPALPTGTRFFAITPCRLVDTRSPNGPYGGPALEAGTDRFFTLAGRCGISNNAVAVAANATVTQPTGAGSLTIFPAGIEMPDTTSINYRAGQTRANNAILSMGTGGAGFFCRNPPSA